MAANFPISMAFSRSFNLVHISPGRWWRFILDQQLNQLCSHLSILSCLPDHIPGYSMPYWPDQRKANGLVNFFVRSLLALWILVHAMVFGRYVTDVQTIKIMRVCMCKVIVTRRKQIMEECHSTKWWVSRIFYPVFSRQQRLLLESLFCSFWQFSFIFVTPGNGRENISNNLLWMKAEIKLPLTFTNETRHWDWNVNFSHNVECRLFSWSLLF